MVDSNIAIKSMGTANISTGRIHDIRLCPLLIQIAISLSRHDRESVSKIATNAEMTISGASNVMMRKPTSGSSASVGSEPAEAAPISLTRICATKIATSTTKTKIALVVSSRIKARRKIMG